MLLPAFPTLCRGSYQVFFLTRHLCTIMNVTTSRFDILRIGPSVSEVASFIAGGISLRKSLARGTQRRERLTLLRPSVHLTLPIAFAGLLLSFVHQREYNAATWSAIGRQVQKSALPTMLLSDGGISLVLAPGVFTRCLLSIFVTTLLPIAGFLTPLPLTDDVRPSRREEDIDFQYVPGTSELMTWKLSERLSLSSYYGQRTLQRASAEITRACDHSTLWGDCPNSIFDDEQIRHQYPGHIVVNTTIPDITGQPYIHPPASQTVAGPFDIQYRNWYEGNWAYLDNNASRKAGFPRPLSSFALSEGYHRRNKRRAWDPQPHDARGPPLRRRVGRRYLVD